MDVKKKKKGKIVKIAPSIEVKDDVDIVDATDKLVMPGGIDPHTHFELNFMGTVTADDWRKKFFYMYL